MPLAVDLSKAPPPEASCFSCGHQVALDRRARARGKFRCPFCRADNRVGPSGVGTPLRGPHERVEDMPRAVCRRCAVVNRLPHQVLRRRRFVCHACGAVSRVPRRVLRQTGVFQTRAVVILVSIILAAIVYGVVQTGLVIAQYGAWFTGEMRSMDEVDDYIQIVGAQEVSGRSGPRRFNIEGQVCNILMHPATYHVRLVLLTRAGSPAVSQVVTLHAITPGEWRRFQLVITVPPGRNVDVVTAELLGVS